MRGWGEKIERERRDERGRDGVGTEGMRGRVKANTHKPSPPSELVAGH